VVGALSGDGDARTVHSLLGLRPEVDDQRGRMTLRRRRDHEVGHGSLVIVDEASMIDDELLLEIRLAARQVYARVLYVGDAYQLPPVFKLEAPVFRLVEQQAHLTTVQRQAAENPIIATATRFREALDGRTLPAY